MTTLLKWLEFEEAAGNYKELIIVLMMRNLSVKEIKYVYQLINLEKEAK